MNIKITAVLFLAMMLWGCASTPPPPPEPNGPLISINKYHPVTGEEIKE